MAVHASRVLPEPEVLIFRTGVHAKTAAGTGDDVRCLLSSSEACRSVEVVAAFLDAPNPVLPRTEARSYVIVESGGATGSEYAAPALSGGLRFSGAITVLGSTADGANLVEIRCSEIQTCDTPSKSPPCVTVATGALPYTASVAAARTCV